MKTIQESIFDHFKWFSTGNQMSHVGTATQEEYYVAVKKLAETKKNQRFINSEKWHSEIVVGRMICQMPKANEVLIYSESLSHEFYSESILASKCRFRIIVGSTNAAEVIKSLPQDAQNRIDFRVSDTPKMEHFLVAGNAFRCEIAGCSDQLHVVCNFYEPEVAGKLRNRFDALWKKKAITRTPN